VKRSNAPRVKIIEAMRKRAVNKAASPVLSGFVSEIGAKTTFSVPPIGISSVKPAGVYVAL
jgi:hypothetical protein